MSLLDDYKRVEKARIRCPICDRGKFCLISNAGDAVICTKITSEKVWGDAGWLHNLNNPLPDKIKRRVKKVKHKKETRSLHDWDKMLEDIKANTKMKDLEDLSDILDIPVGQLKEAQTGKVKYNRSDFYSFPMQDEMRHVTGLRLRGFKKMSYPGSRNGHFLSPVQREGHLIIAEGPTDAMVARMLNFPCVGRPNCNSKVDQLVKIVTKFYRDKPVVLIGDNGDAGVIGAHKAAESLYPFCTSLKLIFPPPGVSDLRDWHIMGLRRPDLLDRIRKTPEYIKWREENEVPLDNYSLKETRCKECYWWNFDKGIRSPRCGKGLHVDDEKMWHWCSLSLPKKQRRR